MYTNTDVLHNKLEELQTLADNQNTDIIAITETLLKNMPTDAKPEDFVFSLIGEKAKPVARLESGLFYTNRTIRSKIFQLTD